MPARLHVIVADITKVARRRGRVPQCLTAGFPKFPKTAASDY